MATSDACLAIAALWLWWAVRFILDYCPGPDPLAFRMVEVIVVRLSGNATFVEEPDDLIEPMYDFGAWCVDSPEVRDLEG